MTLKDYYKNLPSSTSPKTEFLEEICATCKVKEVTARGWVMGRSIPANPKHREILAKATGLSVNELFQEK